MKHWRKWLPVGAAGGLQAVGLALILSGGCAKETKPTVPPVTPSGATEIKVEGPPLFQDKTEGSGIDFTFHNGQEAGHMAILESLGGGVALIDYDGDGLLDIFVTGGGYYDGPDKKTIKGHPNKLYKNLGNWKFKDVTKEVGLDGPLFYCHGGSVCDYDRDGWPDLLVTGWGRVVLYHNEPDGKGGRKFVDVTKKSHLDKEHFWSTSVAWADFDGDGWPDLYICHYVDWSFDNHPVCHYHDVTIADVCPPKQFKALAHALYRNNRDGTFSDVSHEAGLYQKNVLENCKGLGVIAVDLNGDGKPDIYVADDTTDNLLYLNRGNMKFEEVGLARGVARDDKGTANGSMGVDAGDPFGIGRPSLWVTNYENENHALYRNDSTREREIFTYATQVSGIAAIGQLYVAFGTGFLDIDNDGWEDIVIANGHVIRHPQKAGLKQQPVLLGNKGKGRFLDWSKQGGSYFQTLHMGRGLAIGDLDNDGRLDFVVSHLNEPVAIVRNVCPSGNHWLGVELVGQKNADTVGSKITLEANGQTQYRFGKGGGSYLSAPDQRKLFGLGKSEKSGKLTVTWPTGEPRVQTWEDLPVDRYYRLVQGEAKASPAKGAK